MDVPSHPPIATAAAWRAARLTLLEEEKALTRAADRVNASRRRLPMVRLDKEYVFRDGTGEVPLTDLFEGHDQLVVYHFMFDPEWEQGCSGCTGFVNAIGNLSMLDERKTSFALVSRAPFEKLREYRDSRRWSHRWVSSFESDFNYDFHVTLDPARAPVEYNYRTPEDHRTHGNESEMVGEGHGLSVFFKTPEGIHHTYSCYARGVESLVDSYRMLDMTPYGRQEDWEDSPKGWPQRPTYG